MLSIIFKTQQFCFNPFPQTKQIADVTESKP